MTWNGGGGLYVGRIGSIWQPQDLLLGYWFLGSERQNPALSVHGTGGLLKISICVPCSLLNLGLSHPVPYLFRLVFSGWISIQPTKS